MNKKIKKIISKGLMASILFVNIPTNVLAGTLSGDTRYETFEGENIVIKDVLEEDTIDVEIEGNTLVNIFKDVTTINTDTIYSTYENNKLTFASQDNFTGEIYPSYIALLETNKDFIGGNTYTMYFKCNIENAEFGLKGRLSSGWGIGSDYIMTTKKGYNKFVFTLDANITEVDHYGFRIFNTHTRNAHIFEDFVILEGDINYDYVNYFEGIKSVGEQENGKGEITIESQTENLVSVNMFEKGNVGYGGARNFYEDMKRTDYLNRLRLKNLIRVNPGEVYTVKVFDNTLNVGFQYFDENKKGIEVEPSRSGTQMTYTVPENAFYLNVYVATVNDQNVTNQQMDNFKCTLVKGDSPLNIYNEYNPDNVTILLNSPLRGLPSGFKDRIRKRSGQWVVERNIGYKKFDGSENWLNDNVVANNSNKTYRMTLVIGNLKPGRAYIMSDAFNFKTNYAVNDSTGEGIFGSFNGNAQGGAVVYIDIYKSKIDSFGGSINDNFKKWLKDNPVTIIYELSEPIYDALNITPCIKLYEGTTHISNNSLIPVNMKVTLDRVANRAQEAIEAAKVTPTVQNISIARMWINLMRDSILKDEFQENVNDIIQVEDLEIERKKVSANLDLYVRSANMLSMSLSTNSVTFENYSGVEDMELLNAVGITVKSSLPYDLNAYIEDEISNKDKTNTIDVRTLNIRESSQSVYKQFNAVAEKLILKENCEATNDIVYNIDLKLSNDDTHKTDVYKTVIKFEVEQK